MADKIPGMLNRQFATPAIAALTAGILVLFVPTLFAIYKGDVLLGYAPVWFAYAGVTMTEWPWAFWRSTGVILAHWLVVAGIFVAVRRFIHRLPNRLQS